MGDPTDRQGHFCLKLLVGGRWRMRIPETREKKKEGHWLRRLSKPSLLFQTGSAQWLDLHGGLVGKVIFNNGFLYLDGTLLLNHVIKSEAA